MESNNQDKENLAVANQGPQTVSDTPPVADTSAKPDDPNFSADIKPGPDGQIVNVNLPVFLTRHFNDPEKYALLQQALKKVFRVFYNSDEYPIIGPNTTIEHIIAYNALEHSLSKVFEWGAAKVLGALPDNPVTVPGDIEENPYQPEAHEALMLNPLNSSDVEHLQKWIGILQGMVINTSKALSALQKVDTIQRSIISEKDGVIKIHKDKDRLQEQTIAMLLSKLGQTEVNTPTGLTIVPKPTRSSIIEIQLSATAIQGVSEVELVKRALIQHRDECLTQAMKDIRDDCADEAFNGFQDYENIQALLDRISERLADAVDMNNRAARYAQNKAGYAVWHDEIANRNKKERSDFVDEYSHDYGDDEDDTDADEVDAELAQAESSTQVEVQSSDTPTAQQN